MIESILVTGGTGMLGINLVKKLVQTGIKPYVIYRDKKKLFPFYKIKNKVNFIKLDLQNKSKLISTIKKIKPNIVFHLASSYFNPPNLKLKDHIDLNFFVTLNLLEALKNTRIKKFIFSGSAAIYDNGKYLKENSVYRFKNNYGISKLLCSNLLSNYYKLYNFPSIELRFFSIYGDWEKKGRLVRDAIDSALLKKKIKILSKDQIRDYIYVDDAVDALIIASKKLNVNGIFNICSSKKQSTHTLVKTIYKKFNLKLKITKKNYTTKTNDISELVGDNSKAQKILKWLPNISIDEGLNKTITWNKKSLVK